MKNNIFDVIIVGGSYSGLAAAMALGRALRKVLVIDSGKPCNRQTPYSHNFLTQDGKVPADITALARAQVEQYQTVTFLKGLATAGSKVDNGFVIGTDSGEDFMARKVIFATGVKDILPEIEGFAECWGISVLHCPYCHGYEVRNEITGVFGNGSDVCEYAQLISNWTAALTVFTNGPSTLEPEHRLMLSKRKIQIVEKEIEKLEHANGKLKRIIFSDGTSASINALYARSSFQQHCIIPQALGCELADDGYIKVDAFQKTNVPGIFACGDNVTRMRTLANAVSTGTTAGMAANKEMVTEEFTMQ